MRTVNFVQAGNDIAAHFKEFDNLVDIRVYFMPEDHCTIGPDMHAWIMHGELHLHTAPIPHQLCNVVQLAGSLIPTP